ncbi:MFS-type transporter SLC18B1-like [Patiria miniata]|uniref:Major facilitator superfamily (MFS) profile domain-containing protein n=1 Tax=Patiria miniata TaxID=46514 RepID=A0A913ZJS0_PATMI|nr:MFS-type transporter SLC18B1-like [Patiria miniata]
MWENQNQWFQFAVTSALYMSVWLSCSIIAPFFPPEAIRKGANQTAAGLVFGAFSITSFLIGTPLARVVPRVNVKTMFLIGAGLCGCTNMIFGILDKIQDGTIFVTSALLMRVAEAVGSSAALIAAMAMVGGNFPESAPQMLGLLEMFSGLAFVMGPMIGMILYRAGGYELPFFSLGGLCLLLTALNAIVLPTKAFVKPKVDEGLWSLLRIPAVWPVVLALFVSTAAQAVFNVGIAYHTLKEGLLPADNAGIVFFIQGGSYALSTPVFGWILNNAMKYFRITTRVMLILGCVLLAISFLTIGPSPWLPFRTSKTILIVSCVLIGLSMGLVTVPSIIDMVISAQWYGLDDGPVVYGMASGIFLSCFHLGSFVGSTLGGVLIDRYDFDATATIFAVCIFMTAAFVASTFAWEYQCGKGRRDPWKLCQKSPSIDEKDKTKMPLMLQQDQDDSGELFELALYEL